MTMCANNKISEHGTTSFAKSQLVRVVMTKEEN